eukprot:7630189-Lingulodinium_polyedra.AAC.1
MARPPGHCRRGGAQDARVVAKPNALHWGGIGHLRPPPPGLAVQTAPAVPALGPQGSPRPAVPAPTPCGS